MNNRLCTQNTPAPPGKPFRDKYHNPDTIWNFEWSHPDEFFEEFAGNDYGDGYVKCPHCSQRYVAEGSDG